MLLKKNFDIEYVIPGHVGLYKSFVFFFKNKEKNTSRLFFSIVNYKN